MPRLRRTPSETRGASLRWNACRAHSWSGGVDALVAEDKWRVGAPAAVDKAHREARPRRLHGQPAVEHGFQGGGKRCLRIDAFEIGISDDDELERLVSLLDVDLTPIERAERRIQGRLQI